MRRVILEESLVGLAGPKLHIWALVGTNKEQSFG